jgi:hypothetical protein
VYPESAQVGCVEVTARDLMTLEHAEFVNDTIMDFRSMWVKDEYEKAYKAGASTAKAKIHFFSAFFFKKLTEKGKHTRDEVRAAPWLAHRSAQPSARLLPHGKRLACQSATWAARVPGDSAAMRHRML